ncbi:DUF1272 domain-containing protein [Gordonia sp. (in: high G+C Gram-positive bacteria)]|jgi:hypothetical protein|uniref:DUF1272 domain-containing protein n=1 Tax=Gordonia sp. (in: high G+C Gram-positive bacteria) TaxID=84139 RepID=UPI002D1F9E30|nr:DUF1272 domain-containing protein [Gordonia sp. (in: high G+C Gram-positive bacteria)]
MLTMKTACELCAAALEPAGPAWICSYECTYCDDCTQRVETCPNCAGELVPRPRRTTGAAAIAARLPARLVRNVGRRLGR